MGRKYPSLSLLLPSDLFFFINLFIYFLAVLGLRFCARAFSSCGERGPRFIAVRRPLTIVASLVAEHRLQTRRLSTCGPRAQLLRGMWDLPRPGLEPMSPALAGRFSTTAPPGKPYPLIFCWCFHLSEPNRKSGVREPQGLICRGQLPSRAGQMETDQHNPPFTTLMLDIRCTGNWVNVDEILRKVPDIQEAWHSKR